MVPKNLKLMEGLSIYKCLRQFTQENFEEIPDNVKEQEADGNTFLIFSNKEIVGFYPNTEEFAIKVKKIVSVPEQSVDVSKNNFWKSLIGKKIQKINFLPDNLDFPNCIEFILENNENFKLQYTSESQYTFDALIIRKIE